MARGRKRISAEELKLRQEKLLELYKQGHTNLFKLSPIVNLSCSQMSKCLREHGHYIGKKQLKVKQLKRKVGRPRKIIVDRFVEPHITITRKNGDVIRIENASKEILQSILIS